MHDAPPNSARPLISITPRKKSVRFNITTPSPRPTTITSNPRTTHPLNVSYTIPSSDVNIDHVTNHSHHQHLNNNHVEYIPTTRRNQLEIRGEKLHPAPPSSSAQTQHQTLDELHQFMKMKAENLRQNMTKVTSTFHQASSQLNRLKDERDQISKRPSRIPISTRVRSPSPPVVIYKKAQHRTIDDLRWYCLARKFSDLWQKATFGCHLRHIRSFRHHHLLRFYFVQWRKHVHENPLEEKALDLFHRNLLHRCFHVWRFSISENQDDDEKALKHLHRKRLQRTWFLWKSQTMKRQWRQRQYALAQGKYHRTILFRFYQQWRIQTDQRRVEHEKSLRANYHHRLHLQRICFQAWTTYAEYRRRKNHHKKRVADYSNRQLTQRIYKRWKDALTRKYLIQQHEHRLAELQEKVVMRWAFERWKTYMQNLIDEERTMEMAERYSDRRLMRRTLKILHEYAEKRRQKQRMNWIAVQHRARTLERRFYRIWKNQLEEQENISLIEDFHKANRFYQMKITIRYWFYWRRYVNECREENAQLDAADRFFNSKLLRKYFSFLRSNVTDERHEKSLEKRADEHFRTKNLRLFYNFWQNQCRVQERFRMNWRLAILHHETNARQRFFDLWLDRTHLRLIENEQNIVAERHFLRTIFTRAWSTWRQIIENKREEERAERIAIQFYFHSLQRQVLNGWKLYVRHCRSMKNLYRQSDKFYVEHRIRSLYYEWLNKARDRRRLMFVVNERFERKQRLFLRNFFRQWRDRTTEEKSERELNEAAVDHFHRVLKRRVLLGWHQQMIQQISIDNENEMKFHQFHQRKTFENRLKIFSQWKTSTIERQRERFLNERAEKFYEKILLTKVFRQWKNENEFDRRIKFLERQALWFDRMRVLSRNFLRWKQNWRDEQQLNEQKHRALLFWALQLQKRFFLQWVIYVSERKRKKTRYNQATHQRHDELLRQSLRQFLVFTDHTKQRRQTLFLHQQIFLYHDRNALAAKYLVKWKNFVQRVRKRRQPISNSSSIVNTRPLDLVRFDNSPAKISNRPRPRKPAFLSESFSTNPPQPTEIETPSNPIDHSFHSPFKTVVQNVSSPLLLPPSAFQCPSVEIAMPLSSRPISAPKMSLPVHRPYSTQPSNLSLVDKHKLLDVKQRLEIYLNSKAKLKRLRQQLINGNSIENKTELEDECRRLTDFISSEKLQLTDVLQSL